MQTLTYRFSHPLAGGRNRLELHGHRLLVGHADTGIFKIAVLAAPQPNAVRSRAPRRRDDGDGLAAASIEIREPLAIADSEPGGDPRNRRGHHGTVRPKSVWRGR